MTARLLGAGLFLQVDVQTVDFVLSHVLTHMRLGIAPDDLAGLECVGVRFTVRQPRLHCPTGKRVNQVVGMRMHGGFLARLQADIQNAHVAVVKEHLVMCGINLGRVLSFRRR